MLSHTDLKKGTQFIWQGQPWQVLESAHSKMAQRRPVVQTKIKNLITGAAQSVNFQQSEVFKEADLVKKNIEFIYFDRSRYFFCEENESSKRFSLTVEQVGPGARLLKPGLVAEGIVFEGKFISVNLPIKITLKVKEAPPGIKGDRAQGGNKTVILESGAEIQVPLFVKQGDAVEVNTQSGKYVRRVSE